MKRFSKIVSVIRDWPLAFVIKRHELRLQIGRKAREWRRRDIDRREPRAVAAYPDALIGDADISAPACSMASSALCKRPGLGAFQHHVAAGHGDGDRIGAGLDAVGQNDVARAREAADALDLDSGLPGALDLRAHLDEAIGQIDDLWLARGVDEQRMAIGERSRHQRRMGAADRHLGKMDLAADEALRRCGVDIASLDLDIARQAFRAP